MLPRLCGLKHLYFVQNFDIRISWKRPHSLTLQVGNEDMLDEAPFRYCCAKVWFGENGLQKIFENATPILALFPRLGPFGLANNLIK